MANTGYKINPKVIQIFSTGPNIGTMISPSSSITFNIGSGFISSSLCGTMFYYKIMDNINCTPPSSCTPPTLDKAKTEGCYTTWNYIYTLQYNINDLQTNISQSVVEYCLNSGFSGEIGSTIISNISTSNTQSINISSGLTYLPINKTTPVYFRLKNRCNTGVTSSYSNILSTKCSTPGTYCTNWVAYNQANQNMNLIGDVNFTNQLGDRTINTSLSSGIITSYKVNGTSYPCSINMVPYSNKMSFTEHNLPVFTNTVLNSIKMTISIVCDDSTTINLYNVITTGTIGIPPLQSPMQANYNDCSS